MHVTVVLCTWNRSALLSGALEAWTAVRAPHDATWDLVVVDNASTDDTQSVLRDFASRLPLTVVIETKPGLSNARNKGLDTARGEYVLYTDDDVRVSETWVAEFVVGIRRHPEAAVFGGRILPWFPAAPDPDLLKAFPSLALGFCAIDHDLPEGPLPPDKQINGANMGFHAETARSMRFNADFGPKWGEVVVGDERELIDRCRALGKPPIWLPAAEVRHYVAPERMTLEYLIRYYHDWGVTVVRREGPPAGARLGGVPRWLYTGLVESHIKRAAAWMTGRRLDRLVATREIAYLRGLLDESRRRRN